MPRRKTKADKVRERLRFIYQSRGELPTCPDFVSETKIDVSSSHYSVLKSEVLQERLTAPKKTASETPLQKLEKAGKEIAKIMEVGRYVLVVFQLDEETGRPTMELQEAPPPPKRVTL